MTVKECYREFGGDYEDAFSRLPGDEFIAEFLREFARDESYAALAAAMEKQDVQAAFRAAHALKGICQNFGYTKLFESSSTLTELLRTGSMEGTEEPMQRVSVDYQQMAAAIQKLHTDG